MWYCRFHTFFTHLDNYRDNTFLYLTSGGIEATKEPLDNSSHSKKTEGKWDGEESEDENPEGGEG